MSEMKAPGHLAAETRRWVDGILEDYDLQSHHFKILVKAAEAHDRGEEARKILKTDGIVIADRFGTKKVHPAVAIERDARVAFMRGVRELGLDAEQVEAPRAPRTRDYGNRA
ncbi:MAG: P27 family phage terminase small subunit [Pseudomonadota bacterium]